MEAVIILYLQYFYLQLYYATISIFETTNNHWKSGNKTNMRYLATTQNQENIIDDHKECIEKSKNPKEEKKCNCRCSAQCSIEKEVNKLRLSRRHPIETKTPW